MSVNLGSVLRGLFSSVVAAFFLQALGLVAHAENPRVSLETSMGVIEVELFETEAPITVKNFLKYVKKGHFDGTIFHRVIPGFVVQGGGLEKNMKERSTESPIKNESRNGLKNERMTLSMARTSAPDSATSQFYINLADNKMLDRKNAPDGVGYCVFGKVVKGEDIVDQMAKVRTTTRAPHSGVPADPITLVKATILEPEKK
ncbi:MAG: peptidylprolyl isomerase [Planctomycetota bacterium]|jgi:peptidyl-prolyl cis-trans isomerase A (cyclophilin A)